MLMYRELKLGPKEECVCVRLVIRAQVVRSVSLRSSQT